MKIAIVLWELNIKGGTQRQALELALNLKKMNYEVDIFCYYYNPNNCYKEICEQFDIKSVSTEKTKKETRLQRIMDIFFLNKETKKFKQLISQKGGRYDVINLHDCNDLVLPAKYLKHKNIIWMMNDIPGQFFIDKIQLFKKTLYFINQIILKRISKKVKKIVVLDHRVKSILKNKYKINATIIRSGININMYSQLNKNYNKDFYQEKLKIFCSGIFFRHRRFEDVIVALSILKKEQNNINISLTINGNNQKDFSYYNFIKHLIIKNQLQDIITITHGLTEENLKNKYLESHIFIFPNHNQTWGLSVFEACLAQCACIVSKTSGAHEVLTDNHNAILIKPKSPIDIAKNIKKMNNDREFMKKIANNGLKFVLNNLSWEKYTKDMLKIYKN